MLKNQKGITLVALVITIIVLLILATVAITMAIDSDGLFAKANKAATDWNAAVQDEYTTLDNLMTEANKHPATTSTPDPVS